MFKPHFLKYTDNISGHVSSSKLHLYFPSNCEHEKTVKEQCKYTHPDSQ